MSTSTPESTSSNMDTSNDNGSIRIDVTAIAEKYRKDIKETIQTKYDGKGPTLVAFLANKDPFAKKYAEWTGKSCVADGINYILAEVPENELEKELYKANINPNVHGIIIYYPVFGFSPSFYGSTMDDYLRDSISFKKDVEGLSFTYRYNLYRNIRYMDTPPLSKVETLRLIQNDLMNNDTKTDDTTYAILNEPFTTASISTPSTPSSTLTTKTIATSTQEDKEEEEYKPELKCLLPCTALSCVKILESLEVYDETLPVGNRMENKIVTIINRSEIVGRPLAALLANDGATIYSIDIDSMYKFEKGQMIKEEKSQEEVIRSSDVVVTGVPSPSYKLNTDWIKDGAIVLNVASHKNIDEKELLTKKKNIKYVPLVGKVTVAMLERNLMRCYEYYHAENAINRDFRFHIEPSLPPNSMTFEARKQNKNGLLK